MTFHNPTLARCVTTADMMCARDRRAAAQQQLLSLHKLPLVSFTLNIPGPVKRTALAELAFNSGLRILRRHWVRRWTSASSAPTPAARRC